VREFLAEESLRSRGLFDVAGVRRLMKQDQSGAVDGAYSIFALLCIEMWCRLFVDGEWRSMSSMSRPLSLVASSTTGAHGGSTYASVA
jgi:hypothetical protein